METRDVRDVLSIGVKADLLPGRLHVSTAVVPRRLDPVLDDADGHSGKAVDSLQRVGAEAADGVRFRSEPGEQQENCAIAHPRQRRRRATRYEALDDLVVEKPRKRC